MILAGRPAKILLIDTNVYFSKRLSDALKREGFEVNASTQPAFALTTLEYDTPSAIVCSTNMREMGALDIARMIRADVRNAALPVIALGDGSQRALMEAFQAGCDDYIDRTRTPAIIATHIKNIIVSKAEGFQPTQMLTQSDTSLSGSLTHHDLPGVMQMLGHAHQTGALHINAGNADALLFFDAGTITHAECGSLFGDEAVIHILKSCFQNNSGVYKFVYGSSSPQRTVLRSATDLMLDAMREVDESTREPEVDLSAVPAAEDADFSIAPLQESAEMIASESAPVIPEADHSALVSSDESFAAEQTDDAPAITSLLESATDELAPHESETLTFDESPAELHPDESEVIASLIDRYAAAPSQDNSPFGYFQNQAPVSTTDNEAESESLIENFSAALSLPQTESSSIEKLFQPLLPDDRGADESMIEPAAILHSNNFSAATVSQEKFVEAVSGDAAPASENDLPAAVEPDPAFEFSASSENRIEDAPQSDSPAVTDQVFRPEVAEEANHLVGEPDANQNADTPEKESL